MRAPGPLRIQQNVQVFAGEKSQADSILKIFKSSLTHTLPHFSVAEIYCSTGRWPLHIVILVNVTERLFSPRSGFGVPGQWTLISDGHVPLLPCAVPFSLAETDLTPACQSFAEDELSQALRFVEFCAAACSETSHEQWTLRLIAAMLSLELQQPDNAWKILQTALSRRNQQEDDGSSPYSLSTIGPREWLVMATIALGVQQPETAESFTSEAVARMEQQPACCTADLLSDTRADAMVVFATIRLTQQRYYEAEMLLQLSHDAHVQAGDMEQLVVDLTLLADVEFQSGSPVAAHYLLCEGERILKQDFDATRHLRCGRLQRAVQQRLNGWRVDRPRKTAAISLN